MSDISEICCETKIVLNALDIYDNQSVVISRFLSIHIAKRSKFTIPFILILKHKKKQQTHVITLQSAKFNS